MLPSSLRLLLWSLPPGCRARVLRTGVARGGVQAPSTPGRLGCLATGGLMGWPEQYLRRFLHKVQGEVNEHGPGEGEELDILVMHAKDREEHEEEQRVSEGAAHTGAAEDDQIQGFVDDV